MRQDSLLRLDALWTYVGHKGVRETTHLLGRMSLEEKLAQLGSVPVFLLLKEEDLDEEKAAGARRGPGRRW